MATLLIVEDDRNIRETLHELLSESHQCHTADRAEQALAYLEIESYDTVITDIAMPGLTGHEILKHVQRHSPTTPVIVISGNTNKDAAKQLLDMGAFAYVTKPFQLEEIDSVVNRALIEHQRLVAGQHVNEDPEDSSETVH